MELGEVQLFGLQVPGGTTRGRGRARNVRQAQLGWGPATPGTGGQEAEGTSHRRARLGRGPSLRMQPELSAMGTA